MVEWHKRGDLSFAQVRSVNLDEYVGLAPTHDQSYRYFMQHNLFDHVDIAPENTNVPNGLAADAAAECARYEDVVRALGYADLQLLGLGRNGHIGFNEPCAEFPVTTHLVELTQRAGSQAQHTLRLGHHLGRDDGGRPAAHGVIVLLTIDSHGNTLRHKF